MRHTHQPVISVSEDSSPLRAFLRFLGPAIIYSLRHLTLGTVVRIRRQYLRRKNQKWWIE